jgi:hypothetical protein
MDAQEKLVIDSAICCAVIGSAATGECMVVPLGVRDRALSAADVERMRVGGLRYSGVIGYFPDGSARALPESDIDSRIVILRALNDFAAYVAERLRPKSDSLDWLRKASQHPGHTGELSWLKEFCPARVSARHGVVIQSRPKSLTSPKIEGWQGRVPFFHPPDKLRRVFYDQSR